MTKEDVKELPPVPKKRRQVETALDLHIAMWLASDDLTPSERKKLEGEKQRRKSLTPEKQVGILVGEEGLTGSQLAYVVESLVKYKALGDCKLGVIVPAGHRKLQKALFDAFLEPKILSKSLKEVVLLSNTLIACPKENEEPVYKTAEVWAAIKYAKHRSLPVTIVMPDGAING